MKLDIKTKERIDKWFSERTPEEVLFITQKYLRQDQLQSLQSRVVGHVFCVYCLDTGIYKSFTGESKCFNTKCKTNAK